MDRNSIIGFVLLAAILFGYTWYSTPTAEEAARMQRQQDSLAAVELEQRADQAAAELPKPAPVVTIPVDTLLAGADSLNVDSLRQALAADKYGVFHPSSTGSVEEIVLENERMQIGISTKGARPTVMRLKEYSTYDKTPLLLADPDSGDYGYDFFLGNR